VNGSTTWKKLEEALGAPRKMLLSRTKGAKWTVSSTKERFKHYQREEGKEVHGDAQQSAANGRRGCEVGDAWVSGAFAQDH